MAFIGLRFWLIFLVSSTALLLVSVNADDIFLEWQVNINATIKPVSVDQPV